MKKMIRYLVPVLLSGVFGLMAGCGGSEPSAAETAPGPIVVTANDTMQFAPTEFTVQAGSEVTVVLRNIGRMPKEAMGHNLVILTRGTDPDAFSAAGLRHPQNGYIDPAMQGSVIATTRILGPGEEETLVFTAPSEPGEYPFVCSFPAHTPAGMKGIMYVR